MSKIFAWSYKFKLCKIIEILKSTKVRKYIKEVSNEIEKSCNINKFNALILNRIKIINYINQKLNELIRLLNRYRRHQVYINIRIDETKVVDIECDNNDELLKTM